MLISLFAFFLLPYVGQHADEAVDFRGVLAPCTEDQAAHEVSRMSGREAFLVLKKSFAAYRGSMAFAKRSDVGICRNCLHYGVHFDGLVSSRADAPYAEGRIPGKPEYAFCARAAMCVLHCGLRAHFRAFADARARCECLGVA